MLEAGDSGPRTSTAAILPPPPPLRIATTTSRLHIPPAASGNPNKSLSPLLARMEAAWPVFLSACQGTFSG